MRLFLLLTFLFLTFPHDRAWGFYLSSVKVECQESVSCVDFEGRFDEFKGEWAEEKLREKMRLYAFDPTLKKLAAEIREESSGTNLFIKVWPRKTIGSIQLLVTPAIDTTELRKLFPFKEGDYYDDSKDSDVYRIISRHLSEHGYSQESISLEMVRKGSVIDLVYKINIGKIIQIHDVSFDIDVPSFLAPLQDKFKKLRGKTWDNVQFKVLLEDASKELFNSGYLFSKIELVGVEKVKAGNEVDLKIKGKLGERYLFSFVGNKIFSTQELSTMVKGSIKDLPSGFDAQELILGLKREYEKIGVYNTQIRSTVLRGKDRFDSPLNSIYFDISEGSKVPIDSYAFAGNLFLKEGEIKDFYYEQGTPLAKRDLLDVEYLTRFPQILQNKYFSHGYVLSEVSPPQILFNDKHNEVNLEYKIKEREQCLLSQLEIRGIPNDLKEKIIPLLKNKKGAPLNTTVLQNDLLLILSTIRDEGYYFARLENLDSPDLLTYSADAVSAVLSVKVDAGKKAVLGEILITGNQKTKNKVIFREFDIKTGDILTPNYLEELKEKLSSLGLFSFVRITPMQTDKVSQQDSQTVNLHIQLKERDFKTLELAPGYRTDLGAKLSAKFINNNIAGMNRTMILQAQSNLRTHSRDFDLRRQTEDKRLLEYQAEATFIEPYLLGSAVESESSAMRSRKRFYGFDANISKISTQLSKTYWKVMSASIKYQLETISQFDSSTEKDSGYFRIGGLTPGLSLDFRDNKINPRKGAFLGVSWEFANPYFNSMKNDDIEINFYRLISRNKFYIPLTEGWNLATSLSWGEERNLSTAVKLDNTGRQIKKGYIPGIKVFRLDGIDTVRGFGDSEINRLNKPGQPDISDVRIENAAFFTNFKFEPRYLFNDSTMLGVFFDAGRVYVDNFKALDLRTSTGISFKILTPVGSLDFDYGVKLKRAVTDAQQKESFGHFHLSIGYF